MKNEYVYRQNEEYREPISNTSIPVTSKEQLGLELLRTYARLSDPDEIVYKTIKKEVPLLKKKKVINEDGEEVEVEVIVGWKVTKFEIPIRVQSKYRELITDDIARAFLGRTDFDLFLDNGEYCQSVHSFATRYALDLSLHHNHYVGATNLMVCGSGAVEGQRITLAKTDIAKAISKQDSIQQISEKAEKNRKGFIENMIGNI